MLTTSPARIRGLLLGGALALVAILSVAAITTRAGRVAPSAAQAMAGMDMSPAAMKNEIRAWYSSHPEHGGTRLLAAAADTFTALNFHFDTDGNAATQVDSTTIQVGQTILFKWVSGFHTTTSGNPGDVDAGSLWDHPLDNLSPDDLEFAVTFNNAGRFPFFCQPHGATFNMRGVVNVTGIAGVPGGPAVTVLGFTRSPAPNPTHAGVTFAFATAKAGVVHADVFDAAGRRLAVVLDRAFDPGVHSASWDARDANGARVAAGVYYLRLRTPDLEQTRGIAVER